jgi:phage-related protein
VKAGKAASDASGNVKQLTRDLYEAGKVRATPIVDLQDKDAEAKLKEVSQNLRDLGAKVADPGIDVNDKDAVAAVAKMRVKLDELGRKVSSPRVTLEGLTRAEAELLTVTAQLDKLDGRRVDVTVDVHRSLASRLGGLFGGGGGGAGGLGGAGGSAASGGGSLLTSPGGIAGIAGLAGLAAALTPGLIGEGLGGVAGLGAVGGGLFGASQGNKIIAQDQANIKRITTALKSAVGKQKTELSAALKDANKQFVKDSNFFGPFIVFQKSLQDLLTVVLKPLRPLMAPLTKLFNDFGKGLAKLGPVLTQVLDASVPFIHQFLNVLLRAGKTLLPAFSSALNQMVASGALQEMTQGLVVLVNGLAQFIVALGPGMKSSAMIFRDLAVIIAAALQGIGHAVSWVANTLEVYFHRSRVNIEKGIAQWLDFRHRTAVIFDGIRHDIAHIWDMIWNNTIGRLKRGVTDNQRLMNQLRHNIASTYDGIRHDVAAAWDTIWNNTIGRVRNGISDVVGWFKGMPRRVTSALFGLGHSLYAIGHAAVGELWAGFRSVAGSIIGWIKGFGRSIISGLKGLFGIHSPSSVFHGIGENLMKGLLNGLKAGHGKVGSFLQSTVAGSLLGGVRGAFTRSAAVAQAYAASLLSEYHWSQSQMGPLTALWNQESGWNAYAVNPSSGAYGIPQSLGHGHPYNLGDYKNQIIWGLNYIRERYGSPAAAWGHEQRFNWYGSGLDAIISRPTLIGVGERGPEHVQVTPRSSHSSGPGRLVLEFRARHGATALEQALVTIIQKHVEVHGGDVQVALGTRA